jgi:hypothetical protein
MIQKNISKGVRGITYLYSPEFVLLGDVISWGAFNFITPTNIINIPGGQYNFTRDDTFDKLFYVVYTSDLEFIIGYVTQDFAIPLGEVIGTGVIPFDTTKPIQMTYTSIQEVL